jgi:hypothetical protein
MSGEGFARRRGGGGDGRAVAQARRVGVVSSVWKQGQSRISIPTDPPCNRRCATGVGRRARLRGGRPETLRLFFENPLIWIATNFFENPLIWIAIIRRDPNIFNLPPKLDRE